MDCKSPIDLSSEEARVLIQAAELALDHDRQASVFYAEHKSALRRAVRKIEDFLGECPEIAESD